MHFLVRFLCHIWTNEMPFPRVMEKDEILFLFLNLDMVPWNSNLGGFGYI